MRDLTMIINFQPVGRCIWHSDCSNYFGGVMKEVSDDGSQTLMECLSCGKQGHYPHGRVGRVCVEEVTND